MAFCVCMVMYLQSPLWGSQGWGCQAQNSQIQSNRGHTHSGCHQHRSRDHYTCPDTVGQCRCCLMPMLEEQNQLKRNPDTNGTSLTCREVNMQRFESKTDTFNRYYLVGKLFEKVSPCFLLCIHCTECIQSLPTEAKLAKVNDLPPPALSCTREIDAGRVELCGAQWGGLGPTGTQGYQKVPRGTKVPWELKTHWVGWGTLSCAAHIYLERHKYTQHWQRWRAMIYVLNEAVLCLLLWKISHQGCLCTSNWMIVFSFTSMSLVVMECSPSSLETKTMADSSSSLHQSHTHRHKDQARVKTLFCKFYHNWAHRWYKNRNAVNIQKGFSYSPVFW